MKKIHYKNIGFPKTGTNWLWKQLMNHPEVDGKLNDIFKEHRGNNLESYCKIYKKYNTTVNLDVYTYNTSLTPINHHLAPNNIHEYTTHITMFLRSPYEVLNSMYNMEKNRNINFKISEKEFISKFFTTYSDFNKIFNDWDSCKIPVQYFFYEDLKNNPETFLYGICDYLGLKHHYKDVGITFKTDIKVPLVFDNTEIIDYINRGISLVEERFKRDLSHWKK